MKKFTISLAFLAAVLGSYGCHKEDSTPTEETLIVPVVKSIEATRASAADKAEQLLFSVPVKSDAGEEYTLEAWISDTECGMPETKGIPTTKDNLQSFKTKAYCNDLSVYSGMKEATATKNGEGWSYDKTYKWPAAEYCPLTFCSYAPGDLDITLKSATKASFPYTVSSTDAQSQKDLLFAMNNQGPGSDGTVKINFNHALTAVKFIKGEISNCTISSISLVNFHDSGTAECENGNLTWTAGTTTINYTQSFNTNVDDLGDGESLDLDKDHESRTFMVIPQELPNSAKIEISLGSSTITYDVGSATDTKVKDWSSYAGKTVTFKVNKIEPIDIIFVLDEAENKKNSNYVNTRLNTAYQTFIESIKINGNGQNVYVGLITFAASATLKTDGLLDVSKNYDELHNLSIPVGSDTKVNLALEAALDWVNNENYESHKKYVIVFCDGGPGGNSNLGLYANAKLALDKSKDIKAKANVFVVISLASLTSAILDKDKGTNKQIKVNDYYNRLSSKYPNAYYTYTIMSTPGGDQYTITLYNWDSAVDGTFYYGYEKGNDFTPAFTKIYDTIFN